MKAQTVLMMIAMVVLASVMLVSADQDPACRKLAIGLGMAQDYVDSVPKFRLYGQPRYPETCQDRCKSVNMNVGFDYFGKQACCCGNSQ